MENPQGRKLSEIRQLLEYQQQLGSMLPYVDKQLRRQLLSDLTVVEEQINRLRSEICPSGRNRRGQLS